MNNIDLFAWNNFKAIGRGQIISVLIAGTGVFATLLSNQKPSFNFPTLMSLCNYVLLSTFLFRNRCQAITEKSTTFTIQNRFFSTVISSKVWYFVAAILDLEANFLVISAYNYTTVTSIMLLDCFTIPCVMFLSYFFLNYQYTWKHYIGSFLCIIGLIIIIICDSIEGNAPSSAFNPFLGDFLCICGSMMYACSNVLQETLVKTKNREEYLGYLGLYGCLLATIQCLILEKNAIQNAHITWIIMLYIIGFVMCLFLMYANASIFLQDHDSTLFNLSLLTSDVYAVIFSFFMYGQLVHYLYFISFGTVVCGLIIYHKEVAPYSTSTLLLTNTCTPIPDTDDDNDINDNGKYDEEKDMASSQYMTHTTTLLMTSSSVSSPTISNPIHNIQQKNDTIYMTMDTQDDDENNNNNNNKNSNNNHDYDMNRTN